MLGTKNNLFVDRRVFCFKGKWKDPRQDIERNCFYYIKENTLVEDYRDGKETLSPRITIVVFGEYPMCEHDTFTLQTGETYRVGNIILNYVETNILVRDLCKQRVESMMVVLE